MLVLGVNGPKTVTNELELNMPEWLESAFKWVIVNALNREVIHNLFPTLFIWLKAVYFLVELNLMVLAI